MQHDDDDDDADDDDDDADDKRGLPWAFWLWLFFWWGLIHEEHETPHLRDYFAPSDGFACVTV